MALFTKDFIDFFKELSQNNNKKWFDQNRKKYEKFVKVPFHSFVERMIEKIEDDDPDMKITPAESIFRINRDIRFSRDKTPYKTQMSALISRTGKKDKGFPGIFFFAGCQEYYDIWWISQQREGQTLQFKEIYFRTSGYV